MNAVVQPEPLTRSVEDYLKAIYRLTPEGRAAATSEIANLLELAPASVSGMVKRLSEHGLLEHVPYKGVQLTEEGRRAALRTIRRHRLIEAYLVAFLGYTWDTVHDEAERLEHAVSDQLVERMAAVLGHPSVDPHGDPIPDRRRRRSTSRPARRSSELPEGIPSRSAGWMRATPSGCGTSHPSGSSRAPGCMVVDRQPFDGPITIEVEGQSHVIGHELGHVLQCVPPGEDA